MLFVGIATCLMVYTQLCKQNIWKIVHFPADESFTISVASQRVLVPYTVHPFNSSEPAYRYIEPRYTPRECLPVPKTLHGWYNLNCQL